MPRRGDGRKLLREPPLLRGKLDAAAGSSSVGTCAAAGGGRRRGVGGRPAAGTVAARRGQSEAVKLVDELRTRVEAFFTANSDKEAPDTAESEPGPDTAESEPGPDTELPIEGYATLTAVEVIPLLSDLDDEQLDTIEAFEKANRNRSTVLNRIRQRRS